MRNGARQVAQATDIGGALGHADSASRIQQVESVDSLEHLLIGRQCQLLLHQILGLLFVGCEGSEEEVDVAMLKVVARLLFLILQVDVAIIDLAPTLAHCVWLAALRGGWVSLGTARRCPGVGPHQVVDIVHTLQVHRQALQTVGNFAGDGPAVEAADLLKIGKLGNFHAIEPDFPAQTPGA